MQYYKNQEFTYTAYICCANAPLDVAVAKAVQSQIETYKIPSPKKRKMNQNIKTVFLDLQDLPSGNHDDTTYKILRQSKWLIVICSPELLSSKWCLDLIEYFISSGQCGHILPILINGKPEKSLPESLRTEGIEPLYIDLRADSPKRTLLKLRNEKLRLIASILEVNYDELYRRHKSRVINSNFIIYTISTIIVVVVFTIGGWNLGYNRGFTEGQIHNTPVIDNIEPTVEDNKATDDYNENESISKFEVNEKVFDSIIDLAKSIIAASAGIIPALISGHYLLAANKQKK